MQYYEEHINENGISALKKLVGGKVFYIAFPYLNVCIERKKISFESGTMFINCGDINYEITIMGKWGETAISNIDYKEVIIKTHVSDVDKSSCQMNYNVTDPKRESKVIFHASKIRSIVIYESCIQSNFEKVTFDSHIAIILENEKAIILEFVRDMTDFVNLIVADIKALDSVINASEKNIGDYKIMISQRILLKEGE